MAKIIELNLYYHSQNVSGRNGIKQGHFAIYNTILKIGCKQPSRNLQTPLRPNQTEYLEHDSLFV